MVLGVGTYLPLTLLAPVSPATATVDTYDAPVRPASELAWPGYGASAIGAVGFDGILAANGSSEPLPIASISKIVTALVVLDAKPLALEESGPDVTLTAADVALYGKYVRMNGKVEPVKVGLVMTERQLLEVTLVSSANNYAESLAVWAYGSTDAFVAAATAWLASNGLAQTAIVEPTGLSASNVSSASDLVRLGMLAIANPVVAEIVALRGADLPFIGHIGNSNDLLGVDGVDGIKTGTLDEAGACLLFSADYTVGSQSVTVVGVVLGGVDHDSLDVAIRTLLDGVADGFHEVELAREGEAFAAYATPWDQTAEAVASENESVVVWFDTPISATVTAGDVTAATTGDTVGTVTFVVGEKTIEVPLILDAGLGDPGPWWRLSHPLDLFTG